jgi:diguanylate cyclase (GGDEF)-like protein
MARVERPRPVEILLVEDNAGDARLAAEALKESAFNTRLHWVADGVQAMRFLRRAGANVRAPRPDLILLDLNLPVKDGRQLLAELKGDPDLKSIPVVVLTCSDAEEDRRRAYELHANCYVLKPFQWAEFLGSMRAIGDFWLRRVSLPGTPGGAAPERPASRNGARGRAAAAAPDPGGRDGPRILVVEDNAGDARLVRELLAGAGQEAAGLTIVRRLADALRRLEEERFDAVLLDLNLPDSRGLDTLAKVHARAPSLPLVVMTGSEDEEIAARALRQGAQDYLVKGRFDGGLLARSVGFAIERMRSGRMVHYLAHHDGLTDLPNRLLFQDRLGQALEQARRNRQTLAVLFLDLDRFKTINDTLGHAVGDELLVHAAARLRGCVRASDTVARVGGDEFTVLLPEIARVEDVTTVAGKILEAFATPVVVRGHELAVTASIGASLYPNDGEDAETLLKNADAAMYRAKEDGRARCRFTSHAASARASDRLDLIRDLRQALEKDELVLHYQPTVDAVTDRILAFEALVRWRRPGGLVYPGRFLPVAEETGLIARVGEWVLRRACGAGREWQAAGLQPLRVAVNLSAREVHRGGDLVASVRRTLADTGFDPLRLEVEVTEAVLARDERAALRTLGDLHAMGIRVTLDDFGTEHASLNRLKSFSFASVKIDRAFVRNVTVDPDNAAVVAAITAMGHSLRMTVIAEGVETAEQATFLLRHQVDQMQGPFFGEPRPAEDCADLLRSGGRAPGAGPVAASGNGHGPQPDAEDETRDLDLGATV